MGTRVSGNVWGGNTLDAALTPTPAALGKNNCFELGAGATADPAELTSAGCADPLPAGVFRQPPAPDGVVFSDVPLPPERSGLQDVTEEPRSLPDRIEIPDLSGIVPPAADLLTEGNG